MYSTQPKVLRDTAEVDYSRKPWIQYENRPQHIDVEKSSFVLFPGQGAQFVGMGRTLIQIPKVKEMFEYANEFLRTDLLRTCLEGPDTKLNKTIHCQPAIYLVSLAALVKQQEENEELIRNCVATAGFSVGEFAALVFAGTFTFEQGLHLVRVRAEAMQRACDLSPGAMLSLILDRNSQVDLAMMAAVNHCETVLKLPGAQCKVANYLYPDGRVIAGSKEVIDFVEEHASKFGIKRAKRLPVSGAFHTSMMMYAFRPVSNALMRMPDVRAPSIPVLSNVDARPYQGIENMKRKLAFQVIRPVRWEQTLHALYSRPANIPYPQTVEPGPGRQLGSMLKMSYKKAHAHYIPIDV